MSSTFDVAVVGATGLVGQSLMRVLEQRSFPVRRLFALASARSAGERLDFAGNEVVVEDLAGFDFSQVQVALFSAGGSVSAEHAPRAARSGCVVIDNTSHFRYEPDVPLVVPECNAARILDYRARGIIANPNCSTIQMLVAIKPLYDAVGIERINVATYQSVSGAGRSGMEALARQSRAVLEGHEPPGLDAGTRPIAFNVVPHIDAFQDNGYTKEEMKMVWETRKILEDDTIQVNPTTVRVPVFVGHSEAVHLELGEKLSAEQAREILSRAPGVQILDGRRGGAYPTAATDGADSDAVFVGRIREDISHPRGLNLWVVADNVRKGAALNSVQIAEILVDRYLQSR